jgi:hypothetical protein
VDGYDSDNLIEIIMDALMKGGGLIREDVAKKLCFGANGASNFLGGKKNSYKVN